MDVSVKIAKQLLSVLELAEALYKYFYGNITEAMYFYSRDSFWAALGDH